MREQMTHPDSEVLAEFRAGLITGRHGARISAHLAACDRCTGVCDPDEAADALQDAMVSAFRRAADFRGESAVTTWLHRIVVNAALDRLRRKAVRPAVSALDEQTFEALVAHGADPARATDTRLDVDAALRILPPQQRAALVLVDMLGYSVNDAAVILDTSIGTVKSRCARARARLLPHVAHLRDDAARNRSASQSVSPAQGGDA